MTRNKKQKSFQKKKYVTQFTVQLWRTHNRKHFTFSMSPSTWFFSSSMDPKCEFFPSKYFVWFIICPNIKIIFFSVYNLTIDSSSFRSSWCVVWRYGVWWSVNKMLKSACHNFTNTFSYSFQFPIHNSQCNICLQLSQYKCVKCKVLSFYGL